VLAQHEHGLPPLAIELLEQQQRLLLEAQTALLVAVHNVQRVLAPVVVDLVSLERDGQDLVAWVFDGDAEGFEDFDVVFFFLAVGRCCRRGY